MSTWPDRIVRTSLLSATLLALCQSESAAANSAPDITNSSFPASTNEDVPWSSSLSNLINIYYSDPDASLAPVPTGIAIIGADQADGHWEYTTDIYAGLGVPDKLRAALVLGGPGPVWTSIGSVGPSHALLIDYYSSAAGLRFVPNANWNGSVPAALTFIAWDETNGLTPSGATTPSYGNTTTGTGGSTAYGMTQATIDLTVNSVNDAPTLDISRAPYLEPASFSDLVTAVPSVTSVDLLATRTGTIADVDGDPLGIAIIGVDTSYGTWEVSTNGGSYFFPMPAVSPSNALLLSFNGGTSNGTYLRFTPTNSSFTGVVSNALTFRAWDHTDGLSSGATVDTTLSGTGGATPYSDTAETASIALTGINAPVASIVFPEPQISSGADTFYGAISACTPEGLASLESALAGRGANETRAFAWDAVTQRFVEFPSQPTGGLRPDSGIFLATRTALNVDFTGTIAAMPYVLTLQPGWNFVGVPPIDDAGTIRLSHPWADFELVDDTGTQVTDPNVFTDVLGTAGSGAISTARPWYWDGTSYQQVVTLDTGMGYWIKNNSSAVYTLVRTNAVATPTPRLGTQATAQAPRGTITDRGAPPRPPSSRATTASGCGVGSGIGVVLLGFMGALRGIRRRR